jgi:hypothetical protein
LVFLLACCEPLAPVKLIDYSKLVSPIICVGQFNHQNHLGKRCKPNSFSDASSRIGGVEKATTRVVGQGIHSPKYFTMGMSSLVRKKEG